MIRIAVCDDDKTELQEILGFLNDFKKDYPQYPFTVRAYGRPFEFMGDAEQNGGFDLYLLDIVMPGITGIQAAEKLRKSGDRGEIVFLTNSREYGADAFSLDALNYLVKPLNKQALLKCLLKAWEKIEARPAVAVKMVGGDIKTVCANDIVYIESFSHCQEVALSNGEVLRSAMTLTELKEQLSYPNFYSPHRAYLVNFDYVAGITSQGMDAGGRNIPLPRGKLKTTQQIYLDYLMKK